jgi:hypothetical protein
MRQTVRRVAGKVDYDLDPAIDYPRQFIGHVAITLRDGRIVEERRITPAAGRTSP